MSARPPSVSPRRCRLPEPFAEPDVHVDRIEIARTDVHRAGLATRGPGGLEITGSAACAGEPEHEDAAPARRATFELLERVATFEAVSAGRPDRHGIFASSDAPDRYRPARSNGIALHGSLAEARERALLELAERDRVLRSWYGETLPEPVSWTGAGGVAHALLALLADDGLYDVEAHTFPDDGRCRASRDVEVVGVFAFPRSPGLPVAVGLAGRRTPAEAVTAATQEAVQNLAFLWGEPVPGDDVPPGPSALAQLEYWQAPARHPILRRWLSGAHARAPVDRRALASVTRAVPDAQVVLHDLTPAWSDGFRVARVTCASAVPLVFGVPPWAAHLPDELVVQPIS